MTSPAKRSSQARSGSGASSCTAGSPANPMAVPLAVSCPRSGHACHVISSRYRISVTSPEGRLAWRPREGCGPQQGRIGRRSAIPSGAGGIGVLPSSPFQRRPYWSGRRPSPSTAAACPGRCRGSPAGSRASAPRCTRAASYRPGRRRRRTVRSAAACRALSWLRLRSVWFLAVLPAVWGDDRAVGEGELVQVVAIPASEGVIDCGGELFECR